MDANGQVVFQVLPGTNTFTAWDAGGYQAKTVTVTGPATVTFATVAVTVQISDPDSADLAAASAAHAGNTGTFGPKTPVDGNGGSPSRPCPEPAPSPPTTPAATRPRPSRSPGQRPSLSPPSR